jgi:hypothetical protein
MDIQDIQDIHPHSAESTTGMLLHVNGISLFSETAAMVDNLEAPMRPDPRPVVKKRVEYIVSTHLAQGTPGPH